MRGSHPSDTYYWFHIGLHKVGDVWQYINGVNATDYSINWKAGKPDYDDEVAMFLSYDGHSADMSISSCADADKCNCYALCEYKC